MKTGCMGGGLATFRADDGAGVLARKVVPAAATVACGDGTGKTDDEKAHESHKPTVRIEDALEDGEVDTAACPIVEPDVEVAHEQNAHDAGDNGKQAQPLAAPLAGCKPHRDGVDDEKEQRWGPECRRAED